MIPDIFERADIYKEWYRLVIYVGNQFTSINRVVDGQKILFWDSISKFTIDKSRFITEVTNVGQVQLRKLGEENSYNA